MKPGALLSPFSSVLLWETRAELVVFCALAALAQTVSLLLAANPESVDAKDGEGRTALEIGKRKGACEGAMSQVRRAEFMAGATQSLLG